MRYYLWIDGKQAGPYESAKIREMIANNQITYTTLAHPDGDEGHWSPIKSYAEIFARSEPPEAVLPQPTVPASRASVGLIAAVSTNKFERLVFSIIRGFALFWAGLVVLMLLLATINYLVSLFTKPSEAGTPSLAGQFLESQAWQNLGVYIGVVFFLLFILTVISIVLLLLTIERNTRKDKLDVA
jgi:hypothetical protein